MLGRDCKFIAYRLELEINILSSPTYPTFITSFNPAHLLAAFPLSYIQLLFARPAKQNIK